MVDATRAEQARSPSRSPSSSPSSSPFLRAVTLPGRLSRAASDSAPELDSISRRNSRLKDADKLKDAAVAAEVAAEDEATAHAAVQSIDDKVLDAHNYDASIKLGGTILRRQLLMLLKLRVWEGANSPRTVREEYVGSFVSCKVRVRVRVRVGVWVGL